MFFLVVSGLSIEWIAVCSKVEKEKEEDMITIPVLITFLALYKKAFCLISGIFLINTVKSPCVFLTL